MSTSAINMPLGHPRVTSIMKLRTKKCHIGIHEPFMSRKGANKKGLLRKTRLHPKVKTGVLCFFGQCIHIGRVV